MPRLPGHGTRNGVKAPPAGTRAVPLASCSCGSFCRRGGDGQDPSQRLVRAARLGRGSAAPEKFPHLVLRPIHVVNSHLRSAALPPSDDSGTARRAAHVTVSTAHPLPYPARLPAPLPPASPQPDRFQERQRAPRTWWPRRYETKTIPPAAPKSKTRYSRLVARLLSACRRGV
jgi:hypothetical protein